MSQSSNNNISDNEAIKTSVISIVINLALSLIKLIAGLIAKSSSMISDAIHSASDVFSTIVVIIGIKISSQEADEDHPYGHERFECIAALILAGVLFVTGGIIGFSGLETLKNGEWEKIQIPGVLALAAAGISILVKELMFQYTIFKARKLNCTALKADAWHHRSDALSSIGALVGIFFARHGFPFMDSVASVIICLFIFKAAFDICRDSIDKLVDKSCSEEFNQKITEHIINIDGVRNVDSLLTRSFGSKAYVDAEIAVDSDMTVSDAHEIAEQVHESIEKNFSEVKHVTVHVNPYFESR